MIQNNNKQNNELNYQTWLRTNAKHVENSDSYVYENKVISEKDLRQLYANLKITEVLVRGYDTVFTIHIHKENYLLFEEVEEYVAKHIVDTAMVLGVTYI